MFHRTNGLVSIAKVPFLEGSQDSRLRKEREKLESQREKIRGLQVCSLLGGHPMVGTCVLHTTLDHVTIVAIVYISAESRGAMAIIQPFNIERRVEVRLDKWGVALKTPALSRTHLMHRLPK